MTDFTLNNQYRRDVPLIKNKVQEVLPAFFIDTYPLLSVFLQKYYEFTDGPDSPAKEIHDIFTMGDITSIDPRFLYNMEYSLLLGQNSFKGLTDSRLALKLSSLLYRSKGTRFSVEQFFRIFFGEDVEVVYTKENVFIVADSFIGSQSLRYIIDDKLYQTFAVLIKTGIAIAEWIDLYKLFVHPAGLYVGGEVILPGLARVWPGPPVRFMVDALEADPVPLEVSGLAYLGTSLRPVEPITGLTYNVNTDSYYRLGLQNTISMYDSVTLANLEKQYNNIGELMVATSPTFDMDSTASDFRNIRMSNIVETIDQYLFKSFDSA